MPVKPQRSLTHPSIDPQPLAAPADLSRRFFLKAGLGMCVTPGLLGCPGPFEVATQETPRLTARPGLPTLQPTTGLTPLGLGGERDGLLYVPEGYSPDNPAPLFVGLHGAGGDADNWQSYPARAEARGMVLLLVDSRGTTWDAIHGTFGPDVDFMNRALQYTFDRCRINPAQLAIGGFSDGASYALSLGLPNGDLFSHLVAYSPGLIVPSDQIGNPSIFVSHGTQDSILAVRLSRNKIVPNLRDAGYDVTYMEFVGPHSVPEDVSRTALDWLTSA